MPELRIPYKVTDPDLALATKILLREVWDSMHGFLRPYTTLPKAYLNRIQKDAIAAGWWSAKSGELIFVFPDPSDLELEPEAAEVASVDVLAMVSFQIASIFHRKTLDRLAEQLGVELGASPVGMEEALAIAEAAFPGLELCLKLRPEGVAEAEFIVAAQSSDIHESAQGVEFLLASHNPSNDGLLALAGAAKSQGWYRQARAMFELGQRLESERSDWMLGQAKSLEEPEARAALVACFAGLPLPSDVRLSSLLELFEEPFPVAEAAVEFCGYGTIDAADLDSLADSLKPIIGRRDELDEAIAMTIYNVFRESSPPWQARSILRELEESGRGDSAAIAERALTWFAR